jgi:L-ascorbate metabolism protein UlaG (beta-lactamase superfamily)
MLENKNSHIIYNNKGRLFSNLCPKVKLPSIFAYARWRLKSGRPKWPKSVPSEYSDQSPPDRVYGNEIRLSFIGHGTFLIQTAGINIITDPVYSKRCSPFSFLGPKRIAEPGIMLNKLPKIDVVLVSHNHYDHMDIKTLKLLYKAHNPKIFTPIGNKDAIKKSIRHADVESLNWYENLELTTGIKVHLEPAQHWSARGLFDVNKALWGTFIFETPAGQILFIGDTGYNQEMFCNIARKFSNIRLSIIPIGAYEPRWLMQPVHMNPADSVQAHIDLRSKYSVASHFATFQLAGESYDMPIKDLELAKRQLKVDSFEALKIGQFLTLL